MAVMDEFKEERASIKNGSLKQKLSYFWDYYKWHTIGVIAVICFVGSLVYDIATHKDDAFYAAVLNSAGYADNDSFSSEFMEYAGIDPHTKKVTFDTSLQISFTTIDDYTMGSIEKLSAYLAAAQLDVIIAGDEIFAHYANEETFLDLRNILTPEQIAAYEPYFYYVDAPVVAQVMEAARNMDTSSVKLPDPSRPDLMEDPIPVGIYIDHIDRFSSSYYVSDGDRTAMGFLLNSQHLDTALTFLEYLFEAAA
ncbi:MAG: hypothetical protein NC417_12155 [Candidatus Gastranaerophilales bacterium]|nr:hypothetical protein [Candidatus Gastranaerophilales bacterium]